MNSLRSMCWVMLTLMSACGGDRAWKGDWKWTTAPENERKAWRETASLGSASSPMMTKAPTAPEERPWIGVRHDLRLSPDASNLTSCHCLRIGVGDSVVEMFDWDGAVPVPNAETLTVAIDAAGAACSDVPDAARRRASIAGHRMEGNNVVIDVEDLPPGRALAEGIIVAKPPEGGKIIFKPVGKRVPYAKGECAVTP